MNLPLLRSLSLLVILSCALSACLQAQNLVDSLQAQLPHLPPQQQIKVKATLSFWLRNEDPDASLSFGREAVQQGRALQANKELGFALNNLGIFYENQGNLDSARFYFQEALEAYGKAGEKAYQAFILQKLGTFLQKNGLKEEGYSYLQQAQSAYQQLDLPVEEKGSLYMKTAGLALELGKHEQALEFLTASQPIWLTQEDTLRLVESIRLKAEVYLSKSDLDAASVQLSLADSLLQSGRFLLSQAGVQESRARLFQAQESFRPAQTELDIAEEIYLDKKDFSALVRIYLQMSDLSQQRRRWQEALNRTEAAATLLDSVQLSPEQEASIYQHFRDIYMQRRQFDEARVYMNRYQQFMDSVQAVKESKRQLALREAFYHEQAERKRIQKLQALQEFQPVSSSGYSTWVLAGLAGLLLSVVGLMIFLHFRYRQRLEVERMIAQQQKMRFSSVVEEEEKTWLGFSQHLHTTLGQHLHQAQTEIANLNGYVNRSKPQGQQAIHRSLSALESARTALQDTANQLTPPDLEEVGLEASIEGLTRFINSRGKIWLQLYKPEAIPTMSQTQALGIYRLLKEMLFKLEQKAQDANLSLHISPYPGGLKINLKDQEKNTRMVDSLISAHPAPSWANLQTRIAMLDGQLDTYEDPQMGTNLILKFPT